MSSAVETGSQHLGNDLSTLLDMACIVIWVVKTIP